MALYYKCSKSYGYQCLAYAGVNSALVRNEPNSGSPVILKYNKGDLIFLVKPAKDIKNANWISVLALVQNERVLAWMQHKDVILQTDFKKVVDCWPIKYMSIFDPRIKDGEKGNMGDIFIDKYGIAVAGNDIDIHYDYGKQNVYIANGVFVLRHNKYDNLNYLNEGATIDPDIQEVKYVGQVPLENGVQVKWRSKAELAGCRSLPVTKIGQMPNPRLDSRLPPKR